MPKKVIGVPATTLSNKKRQHHLPAQEQPGHWRFLYRGFYLLGRDTIN